jgi:very-short-patch-repair endonuclease
VNELYHTNREKFDWVILGLKVIVEAHGHQHYTPTCFGGITKDEAKRNLKKRQEVDLMKQAAAEEAGWAYVVIKYTEKHLDLDTLTKKITDALGCVPEGIVAPEKKKIKIPKPTKYNWPKGQKLQGRKFNGEPIK